MIEIRCTFDPSLNTALSKFQMRKIRVFLLIFPLISLISGAALIFFSEKNFYLGCVLLGLGLFFYLLLFMIKREMKKNPSNGIKFMGQDTYSYYRFDDNKVFNETVRGTEYRNMTEQDYHTFYKAVETCEYYFLYISNAQAYVIPKKGVITGTVAELSALLSSKLGAAFRYVNMK